MKKTIILILLIILPITLYFQSEVYEKLNCHYCDGNMDHIISVDYKTCDITYQLYGEKQNKIAKLNNVDEKIAIENCRFIFTDLLVKYDVYEEYGYDIEEISENINIYVEVFGHDILLLNDIINDEFSKEKR
jgi:hypothetical protein